MFRSGPVQTSGIRSPAVIGLLTMSVAALLVTIWIMVDFLSERQIVHQLVGKLPPDAVATATALEGELLWQFRLSILVVLNLLIMGMAVVLLSRAYGSSQASLQDIKAKAADILSSMDLAVITTDQHGMVTSINRRGLEFLNVDEECVGQALTVFNSVLPLEEFRVRSNAQHQQGILYEDFSLHADGMNRILRGFCQPMRDQREQIVGNILQLREVTERVLIEDRLRRMERYFGLGSLSAGLHHELKNPLAALSLHVQLLEEELEGTTLKSEDASQAMRIIRAEVERVGIVLENFQDFAALGRLNSSVLAVANLIAGQVDLITPQAHRQGISLHVDCEAGLPLIQGDRVRLEQVLLNLLVNAMEAMPDGGRLSLRTSGGTSRGAVTISVADTGPGIPEELRDRIFDPYFTTKSHGTGMGLALCEKIMRQHGGSMDLRVTTSETVFVMTLPVHTVESEEGQKQL